MAQTTRSSKTEPNLSPSPKKAGSMTAAAVVSTVIPGRQRSLPTRRPKRKRVTDATASDAATHNRSTAKKSRSSSVSVQLPALPDTITPDLLCLFVGINPGIQTATLGHPYAHPSNLYWRLLHSSRLTPDRRLAPAEFEILPPNYRLGNTNLVARATRDASALRTDELVAGARALDDKVRRWRPCAVCLVGKGIWEAVWRWKHGRALRPGEFRYGFQPASENLGCSGGVLVADAAWDGARVFVATSTSGLAASLSLKQKEEIWAELGDWVNERREEGKRAGGRGSGNGAAE